MADFNNVFVEFTPRIKTWASSNKGTVTGVLDTGNGGRVMFESISAIVDTIGSLEDLLDQYSEEVQKNRIERSK
jgi:hypothetical protein